MERLSKIEVRKALLKLWSGDIPFSILRTDNDSIFKALRAFFNKKHVFLALKAPGKKSSIAERFVRSIKSKLMKKLRTNPNLNIRTTVSEVTHSLNSTALLKSKLTPFQQTDPRREPEVRRLQFPKNENIRPFSDLMKHDKYWRSKTLSKAKTQTELFKAKVYNVGSVVYLNYRKKKMTRFYGEVICFIY